LNSNIDGWKGKLESKRKKIVGITLTLLILSMMTFAFNFTPRERAENDGGGNIIRVPEDYSTIHEAINAATPGDTIAIAPVTYHESLIIDKPLTIFGRKGSRPIFDGGGSGTAITISGPGGSGSIVTYVELVNWDNGVVITNSSDCKVYDVIILNCGLIAIDLKESSTNNSIYNNTMISNANGVRIYTSSRNTVSGNEITESQSTGVYLEQSSNNSISGNKMAENQVGVYLESSSNNMVSGNYITNSLYHGVYLYSSSNYNTIRENNIANNGYGFYLVFSCSNNSIHHNNIVNNTSGQVYSYNSINVWDDGYPSGGNYWSDYTGVDIDDDGIGDTARIIDANNTDHYPLVGMFQSYDVTYYTLPLVAHSCNVTVISNSTVSNFASLIWIELPDVILIEFNVTGEEGTTGFCRVSFPTAMMNGTYHVYVGGTETPYILLPCSNADYSYLYFAYPHSTEGVIIIPEFPSFLVLPIFMIATLLAGIAFRRKQADRR
jgi:parallel beta-helix repeat protein